MHLSSHDLCGSSFIKETFSRLRYPDKLMQSTIRQFIDSKVSEDSRTQQQVLEKQEATIRIVLPIKDRKSANQCADNLETSVGKSMWISARCTQVERSRTKSQ